MVLAYYGTEIPEADLCARLVTTSRGTRAKDLRRLEALGFDVEVRTASMTELRQHLREGAPCIIFLHTGPLSYCPVDAPHAVVAVGDDDQQVSVHDPELDHGAQPIPQIEFANAWTRTDYLLGLLIPTQA